MFPQRVAGRIAPFGAVALLAYGLAIVLGPPARYVPFAISAGLTFAVLILPVAYGKTRLPQLLITALPFACLVAIGLARIGTGGLAPGYGPLFVLPILWVALYDSSRVLVASLIALFVTLVTSDALAGAGTLGAATWKRTLVCLAVAAVTGISVKRLVDELRTTRDRFASVLNAATEYSIIATDPDGLITVFNEGAERMLGYEADEMVGKRTLDAVHLKAEVHTVADELGLDPGIDVFVEAARYGIPETREWTYVREDGGHVPVSATVTAMHDERGKLIGYIVIAANITARRTERARTEAIIASQTDIAVAGHETDKVMNRIAARALSLTGASGATVEIAEGDEMVYALATGSLEPFADMRIARSGSLSGRCLAENRVLYCEDSEHDNRVERDACRRVGARSMVVVPLRHQTAAHAVLKVVSPLPHGFTESDVETLKLLANLMGAAVAHAADYARVAEANSRLRDLDRMKDEFVATVSHELRTPLSSIIAYAEMLTDGDAGQLNARQAKMIYGVERNSRRLLGLIEDLLTISQIEAGAFRLTREPLDVRPLVESVGESLQTTAEAVSVTLRVDTTGETGPLMMDADRRALERALINVVANAIKFSPAGGEVDLSVTRAGEDLEIVVVDRGIGIAAEDQPRLFERFFRASSGYDQAISGSGLGLAIVKEIVEGHGGDVALRSTLGEGTTVTLRLPARTPDGADPVATAVA